MIKEKKLFFFEQEYSFFILVLKVKIKFVFSIQILYTKNLFIILFVNEYYKI